MNTVQITKAVNNFDNYYNVQFQQEIQTFFLKDSDRSMLTFADRKVSTFQYQNLTKDFSYIDLLEINHKSNFETAIFFTVHDDQDCYTHFIQHYKWFIA